MSFLRSFARPAGLVLSGFRANFGLAVLPRLRPSFAAVPASRFQQPRLFCSAAAAPSAGTAAADGQVDKAAVQAQKQAANISSQKAAVLRKGIRFPNYRFVMLAPGRKLRSNQVIFKVPIQLNKFQIKNYLEQIYKVKVVKVETAIMLGKVKRNSLYNMQKREIKMGDWKKAYITLDHDFKFPELELIRPRKTDPAEKIRSDTERKRRRSSS